MNNLIKVFISAGPNVINFNTVPKPDGTAEPSRKDFRIIGISRNAEEKEISAILDSGGNIEETKITLPDDSKVYTLKGKMNFFTRMFEWGLYEGDTQVTFPGQVVKIHLSVMFRIVKFVE